MECWVIIPKFDEEPVCFGERGSSCLFFPPATQEVVFYVFNYIFNFPLALRIRLTTKVKLEASVFSITAEGFCHNQIPVILGNEHQGILVIYKLLCHATKKRNGCFVSNNHLSGGKGAVGEITVFHPGAG